MERDYESFKSRTGMCWLFLVTKKKVIPPTKSKMINIKECGSAWLKKSFFVKSKKNIKPPKGYEHIPLKDIFSASVPYMIDDKQPILPYGKSATIKYELQFFNNEQPAKDEFQSQITSLIAGLTTNRQNELTKFESDYDNRIQELKCLKKQYAYEGY